MSLSHFFTVGRLIKLMILGGLIAIFIVIVQSCTSAQDASTKPSQLGLAQYSKGTLKRLEVRPAPPAQPVLTFTQPNGQEMRLSDYRGKYVLLNVWATWCAPCIIEMPMLNDLQAARKGDDFEVITISIDRNAQEAQAFLKENNLSELPAWHDGSYALPAKVGARGLPVSIFYNPDGLEIARVSGEVDWTSDEANALVDAVLKKD